MSEEEIKQKLDEYIGDNFEELETYTDCIAAVLELKTGLPFTSSRAGRQIFLDHKEVFSFHEDCGLSGLLSFYEQHMLNFKIEKLFQ